MGLKYKNIIDMMKEQTQEQPDNVAFKFLDFEGLDSIEETKHTDYTYRYIHETAKCVGLRDVP